MDKVILLLLWVSHLADLVSGRALRASDFNATDNESLVDRDLQGPYCSINLVEVLDSTFSVGPDGFAKVKNLGGLVGQGSNMGPNGSTGVAIAFSFHANQPIVGPTNDSPSFTNGINALIYQGGGTYMRTALDKVIPLVGPLNPTAEKPMALLLISDLVDADPNGAIARINTIKALTPYVTTICAIIEDGKDGIGWPLANSICDVKLLYYQPNAIDKAIVDRLNIIQAACDASATASPASPAPTTVTPSTATPSTATPSTATPSAAPTFVFVFVNETDPTSAPTNEPPCVECIVIPLAAAAALAPGSRPKITKKQAAATTQPVTNNVSVPSSQNNFSGFTDRAVRSFTDQQIDALTKQQIESLSAAQIGSLPFQKRQLLAKNINAKNETYDPDQNVTLDVNKVKVITSAQQNDSTGVQQATNNARINAGNFTHGQNRIILNDPPVNPDPEAAPEQDVYLLTAPVTWPWWGSIINGGLQVVEEASGSSSRAFISRMKEESKQGTRSKCWQYVPFSEIRFPESTHVFELLENGLQRFKSTSCYEKGVQPCTSYIASTRLYECVSPRVASFYQGVNLTNLNQKLQKCTKGCCDTSCGKAVQPCLATCSNLAFKGAFFLFGTTDHSAEAAASNASAATPSQNQRQNSTHRHGMRITSEQLKTTLGNLGNIQPK